eukprot:scaffold1803_cov92-Amphora_coffeaeformis.AAC.38
MMYSWRQVTVLLALLCAATWNVDAFVLPPQVGMPSTTATITASPTKLSMVQESSPLTLAVDTVDPTTFLQDIFGSVLGTPIILAIPIVAALGVASLVVFAIVAYANPAEPDD